MLKLTINSRCYLFVSFSFVINIYTPIFSDKHKMSTKNNLVVIKCKHALMTRDYIMYWHNESDKCYIFVCSGAKFDKNSLQNPHDEAETDDAGYYGFSFLCTQRPTEWWTMPNHNQGKFFLAIFATLAFIRMTDLRPSQCRPINSTQPNLTKYRPGIEMKNI